MSAGRFVLGIYGFTLFLSAACMFALQPMAGRMLLPLVGGTPAGWVVAMAFFQLMLLAGYLLAHLLSRLPPRGQALAYTALLAGGAAFLPVDVAARAGVIGDSPGASEVFTLLALTLSLPFIALSATASTLQRLFMTTGHPAAKDPYFLYAASNLGSFAGLLSYPFLIEPNVTLSLQTEGWRIAYLALLACAVLCLLAAKGGEKTVDAAEGPRPDNKQRLSWLALSFLMCSLLMGVTTYLTTDLISIPLIWVIPLALYLLAFVIAFARKSVVSGKTLEVCLPLAAAGALIGFTFKDVLKLEIIALQIAFFAVFVTYCAVRLAARRPPGRFLSEYYLILSLGGALGGLFNAFLAPHIFVRAMEYPLAVMALPLLLPGTSLGTRPGRLLAAMIALTLLLSNAMPVTTSTLNIAVIFSLCFIIAALCIFKLKEWAGYLFSALIFAFLASTLLSVHNTTVFMTRNFFGALRVYEGDFATEGPARFFMHGTTLHGFQLLSKGKEKTPTAYFTKEGPFGQALAAFRPKNVAVIGLGVGTIACHEAPGRRYTFIDIDPAVIDIAQNRFGFLKACGSPRLIAGDGRLEMAKLDGEKFDMLVIDAFSSDSIPVHLLTTEAFKVYLSRLRPGGVIAVHISNRHFKLHTPIAVTADAMGLQSRYASSMNLDTLKEYATKSVWVLVTGKKTDLSAFARKYGWKDIPRDPGLKPWTDDYTNLLSALYLD